jgi:hypothetical protein
MYDAIRCRIEYGAAWLILLNPHREMRHGVDTNFFPDDWLLGKDDWSARRGKLTA